MEQQSFNPIVDTPSNPGSNIPMEARQGIPPNIMGMPPDHPQWAPDMDAMQNQQQMVPIQGQDMANPFNAEQYNNVNMPDAPLNYGGGMAEILLDDSDVPEDVKKRWWPVFNKDNVLTFLDDKRKESKLLNFDIMKIDMLNSIPYYDYTFEKELEFGIMRNAFETKLDRAMGFKGGNIKNERVMLQSQFQESRQINESGNTDQIKEGFFKRLLGRR